MVELNVNKETDVPRVSVVTKTVVVDANGDEIDLSSLTPERLQEILEAEFKAGEQNSFPATGPLYTFEYDDYYREARLLGVLTGQRELLLEMFELYKGSCQINQVKHFAVSKIKYLEKLDDES